LSRQQHAGVRELNRCSDIDVAVAQIVGQNGDRPSRRSL
jgi:hypothetical protein